MLALAGCASEESIEGSLKQALDSDVAEGSSLIDFDALVGGAWTELVLVCDSASPADVNHALGFDWASGDQPLHSMMRFADGSKMIATFDSGDTALSRQPWIYPCTPLSIRTGPRQEPVTLERSSSEVRFTFDDSTFGFPLWYIDEGDFDSLSG